MPAQLELAAADLQQFTSDGSYVSTDGATINIIHVDGTTAALKLRAPIEALTMTSGQDGCAFTWDGVTATLVTIQAGTAVNGKTYPIGNINGAWVAPADKGCFGAFNTAAGMDSNGETVSDSSSSIASGVFPGPFSIAGNVGVLVGGAVRSVLSETRDGGASWQRIDIPKAIVGARFGQASIMQDDVYVPYTLQSGDKTAAGILHGLKDGSWNVEPSSFTTDTNGFVFHTDPSGQITGAATSGRTAFQYDPSTDTFTQIVAPTLAKGQVLTDVFTSQTAISGYVTASSSCDKNGTCTTTVAATRIADDGTPTLVTTTTAQ